MQVYMLKDVQYVGMNGQILTVSDGYARNFLLPRKLAVEITPTSAAFYKSIKIKEALSAEVLGSKVAMLAEKLKSLVLVIKERVHDDGKLYGSVGSDEIVNLLKQNAIVINKKQVEFEKSIKAVGEHKVTIKLSSKFKPQFTLRVEASKKA